MQLRSLLAIIASHSGHNTQWGSAGLREALTLHMWSMSSCLSFHVIHLSMFGASVEQHEELALLEQFPSWYKANRWGWQKTSSIVISVAGLFMMCLCLCNAIMALIVLADDVQQLPGSDAATVSVSEAMCYSAPGGNTSVSDMHASIITSTSL
jgi:hypothetical protein